MRAECPLVGPLRELPGELRGLRLRKRCPAVDEEAHGRLRSIRDPELAIDRGEVELHAVDADLKVVRHLLVGKPARRHLEDLELAPGQRWLGCGTGRRGSLGHSSMLGACGCGHYASFA